MPKPNISLMRQTAKTKLKASLGPRRGSQQAEAYVDKICEAIGYAWDMWRIQAKFRNLKINAASATGAPGCLDGPLWESFIKQMAPRANSWEQTLSNAIASAISENWKQYQNSITVPGLPWYPSFVAFPGPMAPPMPNVPTPFAALVQNQSSLSASSLKSKIQAKAGKSTALAAEIADALAGAFNMVFVMWTTTQMITNVLGKGPVPSFAPPYVPVGPVVGGDNIATPGHLAT